MQYNYGGDNHIGEQAAREKLANMGNRKCISSEDFKDDGGKSQEIIDSFARLNQ